MKINHHITLAFALATLLFASTLANAQVAGCPNDSYNNAHYDFENRIGPKFWWITAVYFVQSTKGGGSPQTGQCPADWFYLDIRVTHRFPISLDRAFMRKQLCDPGRLRDGVVTDRFYDWLVRGGETFQFSTVQVEPIDTWLMEPGTSQFHRLRPNFTGNYEWTNSANPDTPVSRDGVIHAQDVACEPG